MSEQLKPNSVVKLDVELKIQKKHSHLRFILTTLIHIDSVFNILRKVKKSAYPALTHLILVSEGV